MLTADLKHYAKNIFKIPNAILKMWGKYGSLENI